MIRDRQKHRCEQADGPKHRSFKEDVVRIRKVSQPYLETLEEPREQPTETDKYHSKLFEGK